MTNEPNLPVFDAIQPLGLCGKCGKKLYSHSTPQICKWTEDCPLYGKEWINYQREFKRPLL